MFKENCNTCTHVAEHDGPLKPPEAWQLRKIELQLHLMPKIALAFGLESVIGVWTGICTSVLCKSPGARSSQLAALQCCGLASAIL